MDNVLSLKCAVKVQMWEITNFVKELAQKHEDHIHKHNHQPITELTSLAYYYDLSVSCKF